MLRPKRSKKKTTDGVMKTSLSKPADGSALRRKYAIAGAGLVVILIAVIVMVTKSGSNGSTEVPNSSADIELDMSKFEELHDYDLPNQKATAKIYKHKKSHLQVMAVYPEDTSGDAVFGLNFRTIPHNNHGTAHVVQRAVFSGSEKYPIKDPFNQLTHGSLQSYIDAFTGRDRTGFVVASRNLKDFRNSIDVFLDSVFKPRAVEEENSWIFRQEAWRVEVEVEGDKQKAVLNGNALQEARASQMIPHDNMMNYFYSKLFPDTSYKYVPSGTSDKIVNMNIDELVNFHKKFYHPANAQAFCYGPDKYVKNCLSGLQAYLDSFSGEKQSIREASEVAWQDMKAITTQNERIPYAALTENQDFRIAISWVLNDEPMDARTEVAWLLLEELLIGTRTSLVSKVVHDLNLGDDIVGGLDHSVQQWLLTLGVNGIASDDDAVTAREAITDKLLSIVENGINDGALQAAINRVEHRFLEQSGRNGAPRGVSMFFDVIDKWTYDRDPTLNLRYITAFRELKEEIKSSGPTYLVDLMTRKLIDNEHKINLELYPSTEEAQRLFDLENVFLQQTASDLGQQGALDLVRESQALKEIQQAEETEAALASIPRVAISDIRKTPYKLSPKITHDIENSGVTLIENEVSFSNGIGYVDFAIDISTMDFDHIVLLPLFCRLIQEGGKSGAQTDVKFQRRVDTSTGGISVTPLIEDVVARSSDNGLVVPTGEYFVSKIVIRGSAIASTGALELMNVFKAALFETSFEGDDTKKKVIQMLRQMIDDMDDDVLVNGHTYTTQRIASKYSLPQYINEQLYGVTQLMNMRRALSQAMSDWNGLSRSLLEMNDKLKSVSRTGITISVSGDKGALKDMSAACRVFIRDFLPEYRGVPNLPDFSTTKHPWVTKGTTSMKSSMRTEDVDEAFVIPTRTSHVGKGGQIYEEGERIYGSDLVTLKYLGGFFLFYQLKYTQGALAAEANLDLDSGVLIYQSDRDPSITDTLDVYESAAEFIVNGVATYNKLPVDAAASVVGTIGWLDGPALQPNNVGYVSLVQYLKQETPEVRQVWRDEILNTKIQNFLDMAERLGAWGKNSISVVTSEDELEKARLGGLNATVCNFQGYEC